MLKVDNWKMPMKFKWLPGLMVVIVLLAITYPFAQFVRAADPVNVLSFNGTGNRVTFGQSAYQQDIAPKLFDTTTYDGFGSMYKTGDDTILYFYREATNHTGLARGAIKRREYTISTDTWGSATTIYTSDNASIDAGSAYGGIINNNIYLFIQKHDLDRSDPNYWQRWGYIKSTDLTGTAWGAYQTIGTQDPGTIGGIGRLVEITDQPGTYLIPYYQRDSTGAPTWDTDIKVLKTTDNGTSWSDNGTIYSGTDNRQETVITYIGDGKLISLTRKETSGNYLMQSTSSNYGANWTAQAATNIGGIVGLKQADMVYDSDTSNIALVYFDTADSVYGFAGISISDADTVYANASSWEIPTVVWKRFYSTSTGHPGIVKTGAGEYYYHLQDVSGTDADIRGGYFPLDSEFDTADVLTITASFYADSAGEGANRRLVSNGETAYYYFWNVIRNAANKLGLYLGNASNQRYAASWLSDDVVSSDAWHRVIASYDKDRVPRVIVTLDGVQIDGTDTGHGGSISTPKTSLAVGEIYSGAVWQNSWDGYIRDVGVYESSTNDPVYLVHSWAMDEGAGATVDDSTANANDGTITGATWTTSGDYPVLTVSTLGASGVSGSGGTQATLRGTLSDLGFDNSADTWFEWGYTTGYGNTVGLQSGVTDLTTYTYDLTGFDRNQTVYYRFVGENIDGTTYGSAQSFIVSEPGSNLLQTVLRVVLAMVIVVGVLATGRGSSVALLLSALIGIIAFVIIDLLVIQLF